MELHLRKLLMPFEHFCGAKAWKMPAVWEQHCFDSVLAGKAVSAEDHRLAVNTANVMGWKTAPAGAGEVAVGQLERSSSARSRSARRRRSRKKP